MLLYGCCHIIFNAIRTAWIRRKKKRKRIDDEEEEEEKKEERKSEDDDTIYNESVCEWLHPESGYMKAVKKWQWNVHHCMRDAWVEKRNEQEFPF